MLKVKRYLGDVIAHKNVFVMVWDKLLKLRTDDPKVKIVSPPSLHSSSLTFSRTPRAILSYVKQSHMCKN